MKKPVLTYTIIILLASTLIFSFAIWLGALKPPSDIDVYTDSPAYSTVIIDPGHGGEDGGASSRSGLIEKNINLELAFILKEKLEARGVNVIMTRTTDTLLYDRNVDYQGRKKVLDMQARLKIMSESQNCIFVSLHMNTYSSPKYSGLQVWYSDNDADSQVLANTIQAGVKATLQPENNRKTKSAGTSIFLLDKATCPAVLVECGFLSNAAEAKLFESDEYKQSLCKNLCGSIIEFLGKC